jgi:hypothetical protein
MGAFMSEWQPIETAPKDGTDILVADYRVAGGFMNVVAYTDEDFPNVWETQEFLSYHHEAFTHWMPLPNPPITNPHASESSQDGS